MGQLRSIHKVLATKFIGILLVTSFVLNIGDSLPVDDFIDKEIPGEPLNPDDFELALKYARDISLGLVKEPEEDTSREQVLRTIDKPTPKLWKNARVPYEIHSSVPGISRAIITRAISDISTGTCVIFRARMTTPGLKPEKDYLSIKMDLTGSSGCASYVGRQGGKQVTTMTKDCLNHGSTVHELMHVIGFEHEHQRTDRNDFVTIHEDHIVQDLRSQFEMIEKTANMKTEYDYGSILHYSEIADCISPCLTKTIEPKKPYNGEIGQRRGLSSTDKQKIIKTYNCNDIAPTNEESPSSVSSLIPGILLPGFPGGSAKAGEECVDLDHRCAFVDTSTFCGKNYTWINFNCRRTCNNCDSSSSCRDYNPKCEYWSRRNFCKDYPEYMLLFCQRSCQLCEAGKSFPISLSP